MLVTWFTIKADSTPYKSKNINDIYNEARNEDHIVCAIALRWACGKFTAAQNDNEGRCDVHTHTCIRYYLFSIIPNLSLLRIILVSLFVDALSDRCS